MNWKRIPIIYWLLYISIVILAFVSGRFIKDYPILELEKKVSVIDVFDALVTVALAVLIPIYIRNFLERKDKINEVVYDFINDYKKGLDEIQSRFIAFYKTNNLTEGNKSELYVYSEILEKKLESLEKIYKEVGGKKSTEIIENLTNKHINLWRIITGETISDNAYTIIDENLFKEESKAYQEIIECISELNFHLIKK
jgi:DNA integrity scanning protein DisA with diadenylate cyclase activity